jgi:hypothetical protein
MHGALYDIPIRGLHDNLRHPHLVAVEYGRNCLCIPAFTAGGHELERTLKSLERENIFRHECSVELDNARYITFFDGRTPHFAVWIAARRQILSTSFVSTLRPVGQMNDQGMLQVLECILEWHKNRPSNLPPNAVRGVQKHKVELLDKIRGNTS